MPTNKTAATGATNRGRAKAQAAQPKTEMARIRAEKAEARAVAKAQAAQAKTEKAQIRAEKAKARAELKAWVEKNRAEKAEARAELKAWAEKDRAEKAKALAGLKAQADKDRAEKAKARAEKARERAEAKARAERIKTEYADDFNPIGRRGLLWQYLLKTGSGTLNTTKIMKLIGVSDRTPNPNQLATVTLRGLIDALNQREQCDCCHIARVSDLGTGSIGKWEFEFHDHPRPKPVREGVLGLPRKKTEQLSTTA